ncbi:MAG: hypothetical protein IPN38_07185 [Flavobacteriales bacterium]|nr:hypothetical protein [Flavobacteriales bacterium]
MLAAVARAGTQASPSQQLALQLGIQGKGQRYLVFDALEASRRKGK